MRRVLNSFIVVTFIFGIDIRNVISAQFEHLTKEYLQGIIEEVNSNERVKWEAGHNFDTVDSFLIEHMIGSLDTEQEDPEETVIEKHIDGSHSIIPHGDSGEWDGAKEWSYCPSVAKVQNQGRCASDWALAPLSAISDRICIQSKGKTQIQLSPHEPISCCKTCGWGCKKGYPQMVYKQFVTKGIVTGGDYKSKKGCQPYEFKPCKKNYRTCFLGENFKTPKCRNYCYNDKYNVEYEQDRYKGIGSYVVHCPYCAAGGMKANGPITATFMVYEDFLTYKKGIYHHVSGKRLGKLTVKVIGFNDTNPDEKYWIAVNSWGEQFGDKGLFKILRGNDECMFEGSLRFAVIKKQDEQ